MPPLVIVLPASLAAVPVCMAVGYRSSASPTGRCAARRASRPLITAIGVSILLQHLALLVWSRNIIAFPQIIELKLYHLGGRRSAAITNIQVAIIFSSRAR